LRLVRKMHVLQSKHTKLNKKQVEELLKKYNISLSQLPRISDKDPGLPEGCKTGDVVKIERKEGEYFRVVV